MDKGVWFWVLFVISLVLCGINRGTPPENKYAPYFGIGSTLMLYVLFGLLGWAVFGSAIK